MSHSHLSQLRAWARIKKRPVTVFQFATTAEVPHVVWFGVVDLGQITLFPNGRVETRHAHVNPDCRISSETAERTGICDADVANQPSWAAWAPIFHLMAQEHIMLSFDLHAFGREVVQIQNERYGVAGTAFLHGVDARSLPGVAGSTLREAAARFGVQPDPAGRALDAAWVTARLVEAVAARHGLEALDACTGASPSHPPSAERVRDSSRAEAAM